MYMYVFKSFSYNNIHIFSLFFFQNNASDLFSRKHKVNLVAVLASPLLKKLQKEYYFTMWLQFKQQITM